MDFSYVLLLAIFLLSILTILLNVINKVKLLEARVKSMNYTLDQIAEKSNIPENPVNKDLRYLVESEKEVEAVKKAREVFGFSLLEAKKYVDEINKT
ncbi:hypothetical protein [Pontibacillus marinus]|uniref:Ribosomal protein L7/L12 C-terminal domain-containing protein n=1 Tax=Pontibacillus marinus BH030004 = DSM 16465 TaxID=1385511 RepID=A0A0A5GEM5_9BACI|nr:hypothetical protein [Pontibacillus marinus]KGX89668.1 hypothetical protein N783_04880 [Pontibacillus marinus BH030004 = DSM 16465]